MSDALDVLDQVGKWKTPQDITGYSDSAWMMLASKRTNIGGVGVFDFDGWLSNSD